MSLDGETITFPCLPLVERLSGCWSAVRASRWVSRYLQRPLVWYSIKALGNQNIFLKNIMLKLMTVFFALGVYVRNFVYVPPFTRVSEAHNLCKGIVGRTTLSCNERKYHFYEFQVFVVLLQNHPSLAPSGFKRHFKKHRISGFGSTSCSTARSKRNYPLL